MGISSERARMDFIVTVGNPPERAPAGPNLFAPNVSYVHPYIQRGILLIIQNTVSR